MAAWTVVRTARKQHRCSNKISWGCPGPIQPGEQYLAHALAPGDGDAGNTNWWHSKECRHCATAYGRGDLLDPKGSTQ